MIPSKPTRRESPSSGIHSISRLFAIFVGLPRPFRFLGVGAIGLITDLCIFTALFALGPHPLLARLFSLAAATVVTWRLNRAVTFDPSHRHQAEEAFRYATVTAAAQGTSYTVFAILVVTLFSHLPQAAIIAGAALGAGVGYCGHRFFAFLPRRALVPQEAKR